MRINLAFSSDFINATACDGDSAVYNTHVSNRARPQVGRANQEVVISVTNGAFTKCTDSRSSRARSPTVADDLRTEGHENCIPLGLGRQAEKKSSTRTRSRRSGPGKFAESNFNSSEIRFNVRR